MTRFPSLGTALVILAILASAAGCSGGEPTAASSLLPPPGASASFDRSQAQLQCERYEASVTICINNLTMTLTNTGSVAFEPRVWLSGNSAFSEWNDCPLSLAPGSYCDVTVDFYAPQYLEQSFTFRARVSATAAEPVALRGLVTAEPGSPPAPPHCIPRFQHFC